MLIGSEVKSEALQSPDAVCREDQVTVLRAGRQRTWSQRSGSDLGAQGSALDLARSSALKELENNLLLSQRESLLHWWELHKRQRRTQPFSLRAWARCHFPTSRAWIMMLFRARDLWLQINLLARLLRLWIPYK